MAKRKKPLVGLDLLNRVRFLSLNDKCLEEASRMAKEAQGLSFGSEDLAQRISDLAAKRSTILGRQRSQQRTDMLKHLDALKTVLEFKQKSLSAKSGGGHTASEEQVAAAAH